MGYDIERFIGQINEGLLCCICRDVLEDPVQSPCEHAYCKSCIEAWLVQETRCPEDREPLTLSSLRPLFRYMKNDLDKLQVKCVNGILGCHHVACLEFVASHEKDCPYGLVQCTNRGCDESMARKDLAEHVDVCKFRNKECPNGCGMLMTSQDARNHNCITELKTLMDILRSEMTTKCDEQRQEMELRLNMQRVHMVQKQVSVQNQVEELKAEISKMGQKIKLLMDLEIQRRQDIERLELEKKELMEMLKGTVQNGDGHSKCTSRKGARIYHGKVTTI